METISLDGGWQADLGQGFVDAPVPGCWEQLGGSKRFAGPVTFRKVFRCPPMKTGQRFFVAFDGVSYACRLSVNGRPVGTHEGMWDRFRLDVTGSVHPGENNEILLGIEKPGYSPDDMFPLRDVLSGFVPDVGCTFGGIWGSVELCQGPAVVPDHALVRCGGGGAEVRIVLENHGAVTDPSEVSIRLSRSGREVFSRQQNILAGPGPSVVTERFALDGLALWRLEDPALYDLDVNVRTSTGAAALQRRIGLREVRAEGGRILLNGEPIYLRGALHWGWYPDRIIPRPTPEEIRRELTELRGLGFNAVKHCLWVPRDEYYTLCDEMGFLAWLELPLWLPRMSPALEERMQREYPRIVAQVADHPSVVIYSLGCELGADVRGPLLEELAREVRDLSGGALLRDNSGSGECYGGLAEDYSDFYDYHFYAEPHFLEPLMETFTPGWRPTRPWLFGEYADADTWREVPAGPGAPWWASADADTNPVSVLKPDFRQHLRQARLAAPGIRGRSADLAAASREHALLHRKLTIEATRAFPAVGGYNVTAIRDVPIATSGLFDDEGRAKFRPEELRPFNADLVLAPRWDLARVWIKGDRVRAADRYNVRAGEELAMRVVVSNFGPRFTDGQWSWDIRGPEGSVIASGNGTLGSPLARGETREIARMSAAAPRSASPLRLTASVSLRHAGGGAENSWPIFVWPSVEPSVFPPGSVVLHDPVGCLSPMRELYAAADWDDAGARPYVVVAASVFDDRLRRHVLHGGRALLVQRGHGAFPSETVGFWREGFALFEDHPLAAGVPRGSFRELALLAVATDTALSWIEPGGDVRAVRPAITRIDAREQVAQHYLVELAFGRGRLVVTTLRLEGGLGTQPTGLAASSFARFLVEQAMRLLRET